MDVLDELTAKIDEMAAGTERLACFEIHDDRVRVLAVPSTGLIDRDMALDAARSLWAT